MAGPTLEGLVNATLLRWAREASSLDLDSAAKKIGVSSERLGEWERGTAAPTISQLRATATVYRRAVTFFFLRERPKAARKPLDFRRIDPTREVNHSLALASAIRDAEVKREAVLDILREQDQAPPNFGLRIPAGMAADDAADLIARRLRVSPAERAGWADEYAALRAWKTAAESLGVLVMQVSGVDSQEMRGCSLALFPMPVVLLNSKDRPLGRVFTLLHELTHLARRESALCDLSSESELGFAAKRTEEYCNRVAGSVLVPRRELLAEPDVRRATASTEWGDKQLQALRRRFWASKEVVLRRLLQLDKTSQAFYVRKRAQFIEEYARAAQKESVQVPIERRVVGKNGRLLTSIVLEAYSARAITGTDLSRILGTKIDHLSRIATELRGVEAV